MWTVHAKVYERGELRDLEPSVISPDLLQHLMRVRVTVDGKPTFGFSTPTVDVVRRTITYVLEVVE